MYILTIRIGGAFFNTIALVVMYMLHMNLEEENGNHSFLIFQTKTFSIFSKWILPIRDNKKQNLLHSRLLL